MKLIPYKVLIMAPTLVLWAVCLQAEPQDLKLRCLQGKGEYQDRVDLTFHRDGVDVRRAHGESCTLWPKSAEGQNEQTLIRTYIDDRRDCDDLYLRDKFDVETLDYLEVHFDAQGEVNLQKPVNFRMVLSSDTGGSISYDRLYTCKPVEKALGSYFNNMYPSMLSELKDKPYSIRADEKLLVGTWEIFALTQAESWRNKDKLFRETRQTKLEKSAVAKMVIKTIGMNNTSNLQVTSLTKDGKPFETLASDKIWRNAGEFTFRGYASIDGKTLYKYKTCSLFTQGVLACDLQYGGWEDPDGTAEVSNYVAWFVNRAALSSH